MTEFTTWRSLVDGTEISAIPDSVVLQARASELDLNDGDSVTSWPDISGDGNDLSTDSGDPSYHEDVINGEPVVRSHGNETMTADIGTIEMPFAISYVSAVVDDDSNEIVASDDSEDNRIGYRSQNGNNRILIRIDGSQTDIDISQDTTNFHIFTYWYKENDTEVRVNGETVDSGISGTATWENINVMSRPGGDAGFAGDLPEFVFDQNADTSDNIESIESDLSSRYGITLE